MKPVLETKSRIVEGCRKYFIELVDKAFEEGKDWKTLEKITRLNDATLRRWYDGTTIATQDVGNMLAAIIALGGTAMQAIAHLSGGTPSAPSDCSQGD